MFYCFFANKFVFQLLLAVQSMTPSKQLIAPQSINHQITTDDVFKPFDDVSRSTCLDDRLYILNDSLFLHVSLFVFHVPCLVILFRWYATYIHIYTSVYIY